MKHSQQQAQKGEQEQENTIVKKEDIVQKMILATQVESTQLSISKSEIIRALAFALLYFFIVFSQLNISIISAQNQAIDSLMFTYPQYLQLTRVNSSAFLSWIQDVFIPMQYNDHLKYWGADKQTVYSLKKQVQPVSPIRLVITRNAMDQDSKKWLNENAGDTSDIANIDDMTFQYDTNNGGFVMFLPTLNSTQEEVQQMFMHRAPGFFDLSTAQVHVDASFYSPNTQHMSFVQASLSIMVGGMALETHKIITFRNALYESPLDYSRAIMEAMFFIMFVYYFLAEFIKIYKLYKKEKETQQQLQKKLLNQSKKKKICTETKAQKQSFGQASGMLLNQNQNQNASNFNHSATPNLQNVNVLLGQGVNVIGNQLKKGVDFVAQSKEKLRYFFTALKQHVSKIWSMLDVLAIACNLVAIIIWLKIIEDHKKIDAFYRDQIEQQLQQDNMNKVNEYIKQIADRFDSYFKFVAVFGLIQILKLMRYLISFSKRMTTLMQIIFNVIDFLLFYVILIAVVFLSFVFMTNFYFGERLDTFKSIHSSTVYLVCNLLGNTNQIFTMFEISQSFTLFFSLLYSLLFIFILINMFLIIVKNEYTTYKEKHPEPINSKQIQAENKQIPSNKFDYDKFFTIVVFEYFVKLWWEIIAIFWKARHQMAMTEQRNLKKTIEVDQKNFEHIDFDISFEDTVNEYKQEETGNIQVESEKQQAILEIKRSNMQSIWGGVFTLIFLALFIIFLNLYQDIANNYETAETITTKIKSITSLGKNGEMLSLQNVTDINKNLVFISEVIPSFFMPVIIDNQTIANFIISMQAQGSNSNLQKAAAQQNLSIGYTIHKYNILINDKVRLTIRKSWPILSNNYVGVDLANGNHVNSMHHFIGDSSSPSAEFTGNYYNNVSNTTINHSSSGGYRGTGGYIFITNADESSLSKLTDELYRCGFLDESISSIVVDFGLMNLLNMRTSMHVAIRFQLEDTGYINSFLYLRPYKSNHWETTQERVVFAFQLIILICYVTLLIGLLNRLYFRYITYQRWLQLYVKNTLPAVMIYHRRRKRPEHWRLLAFLMEPKVILNAMFVLLLGASIILIVIFEYRAYLLEKQTQLFGYNFFDLDNFIQDPLSNTKLEKSQDVQDIDSFLTMGSNIGIIRNSIMFLNSLAAIVLCVKLIYYLYMWPAFRKIVNSILLIIRDMFLMLIIFFGFLTTFAIFMYINFGPLNEQFSTIFLSYQTLLEYLTNVQQLEYFQNDNNMFNFYILLPYFFSMKFVLLNMFLSIIFRCYQIAKQQNPNVKGTQMTFSEFIQLSIQNLQSIFNQRNKGVDKETQLYTQILDEAYAPQRPFDNMKESIRSSSSGNMSLSMWSNLCAGELQKEVEIRHQYQEKCDQILQEYFRKSNSQREYKYFAKLKQQPEKRRLEYQLRCRLWNYFRVGSLYLLNFQQYFKKSLQIQQYAIDERRVNRKERINPDEYNMKLYIQELQQKVEHNLNYLSQIAQIKDKQKILQDQQTFKQDNPNKISLLANMIQKQAQQKMEYENYIQKQQNIVEQLTSHQNSNQQLIQQNQDDEQQNQKKKHQKPFAYLLSDEAEDDGTDQINDLNILPQKIKQPSQEFDSTKEQ